MVSRRTILTSVAMVPVVGLAGCAGNLVDEEYTADPAGLTQSTLQNYEYSEATVSSKDITRDLADQTVTVTSWASIYRGSDSTGTLDPVFGVLSTPQVTIAGTEQNPADGWTAEDVVTELEGEVDFGGSLDNLSTTGTQSVQILGATRTVTDFTATIERNGTQVDVTLHVSETFTDGDDILAVAGAYPQYSDEQQTILDLMAAVEHPIEVTG